MKLCQIEEYTLSCSGKLMWILQISHGEYNIFWDVLMSYLILENCIYHQMVIITPTEMVGVIGYYANPCK
jgi:hypothetical protein